MPPPRGRPYNYSPRKIRTSVPDAAGVYWLRDFDGVSYIGESGNLRRRIAEHTEKEPIRFQYNTVTDYCNRYTRLDIPWKSPKEMAHKIEQLELILYREAHGSLPPLNRKWNNHTTHELEEMAEWIYQRFGNWWP